MPDLPRTFTPSWSYALTLGNDRAATHHTKQHICWDSQQSLWKVEDQ